MKNIVILTFLLFFNPEGLQNSPSNASALNSPIHFDSLIQFGKYIGDDYGYWIISARITSYDRNDNSESMSFIRGSGDKEDYWFHEDGTDIGRLWALKELAKLSLGSSKILLELSDRDKVREIATIIKDDDGWIVTREKFPPKKRGWFYWFEFKTT